MRSLREFTALVLVAALVSCSDANSVPDGTANNQAADCTTDGAVCCGRLIQYCKDGLDCGEDRLCHHPKTCDSQGAKCCSFLGITYCKGYFYCYKSSEGEEWCNDPGYR